MAQPTNNPQTATNNAASSAQQGMATANQNQVRDNNSQLNGAVQNTGYYGNEVRSGTAATTEGYDASARNLKQSMEAAGVQGNSGVAQGNATALEAQEASALAGVKTNAYADTERQQLAANAQDLEASGQQSQAGVAYSGQANEDALQTQRENYDANSKLIGAVTNAGMTAATGGFKGGF